MTAQAQSNEFERWRWNDDYWASTWPAREQFTDSATAALMARAVPSTGERVLDVGCGCGAVTLRVARSVGADGAVVGADISEPLLAVARATAEAGDSSNVSFVLADAQLDPLPGGPFALVVSRFGVMFFEQPVEAFANLRRHATDDARLAFACWQAASENPWFLGHAIGGLLPEQVPPAPGAHSTGPFAFADPTDVKGILEASGWSDVRIDEHRSTAVVDRVAIADEGQPAFMGVAPEDLDEAHAAIDRHVSRFELPDGRLDVPIAYYVVSAVAGDRVEMRS
jgi:SAM-dependent methyltransferase